VRFTPLQVEQVLIWREEHLRNMLAVHEQRQQLNTGDCATENAMFCHSEKEKSCRQFFKRNCLVFQLLGWCVVSMLSGLADCV